MKSIKILLAILLWIIEYFVVFGVGSLPFGRAVVAVSYPLASIYLFIYLLFCKFTWKCLGKFFKFKRNQVKSSNELKELQMRIEKLKKNILFLENSNTDNLIVEKNKSDLLKLNEEYNAKTKEILISIYKEFRDDLIKSDIRKLNISEITIKYEKLKDVFLKKYYKNNSEEIDAVKLCNSDYSYISSELVKIQNELLVDSLAGNELTNRLQEIKKFMDSTEEREPK